MIGFVTFGMSLFEGKHMTDITWISISLLMAIITMMVAAEWTNVVGADSKVLRDNGPDLMGVSGDGDVKSGPCSLGERSRLYPMAASTELIFGIAFEA